MRIGIDLDGVVFDTLARFRELCQECKIEGFKPEWIYCDLKALIPEHFDKIHWTFRDPEFIKTISFIPGAKRGIREMVEKDKHEIIAISGRGDEVWNETRKTLTGVLPPENIYCIGWKGRAEGKVELCRKLGITEYIEDDPLVAEVIKKAKIKVYIFDQIYNHDLKGYERIYSWSGLRARFMRR